MGRFKVVLVVLLVLLAPLSLGVSTYAANLKVPVTPVTPPKSTPVPVTPPVASPKPTQAPVTPSVFN